MHSSEFFRIKLIARLILKREISGSHTISDQSLLLSTNVLNDYLKHRHEFVQKIQHERACREINPCAVFISLPRAVFISRHTPSCCIFRTNKHRGCFKCYIVFFIIELLQSWLYSYTEL